MLTKRKGYWILPSHFTVFLFLPGRNHTSWPAVGPGNEVCDDLSCFILAGNGGRIDIFPALRVKSYYKNSHLHKLNACWQLQPIAPSVSLACLVRSKPCFYARSLTFCRERADTVKSKEIAPTSLCTVQRLTASYVAFGWWSARGARRCHRCPTVTCLLPLLPTGSSVSVHRGHVFASVRPKERFS